MLDYADLIARVLAALVILAITLSAAHRLIFCCRLPLGVRIAGVVTGDTWRATLASYRYRPGWSHLALCLEWR